MCSLMIPWNKLSQTHAMLILYTSYSLNLEILLCRSSDFQYLFNVRSFETWATINLYFLRNISQTTYLLGKRKETFNKKLKHNDSHRLSSSWWRKNSPWSSPVTGSPCLSSAHPPKPPVPPLVTRCLWRWDPRYIGASNTQCKKVPGLLVSHAVWWIWHMFIDTFV